MGHIAQPSKVKFCIIFYIFTFFPFQYYISHSRLQDLMLIVAAWHHSKFGRNFCIGQTTIQLKDFCFGEPFQRWYKLEHSEQRGRNLSSVLSGMEVIVFFQLFITTITKNRFRNTHIKMKWLKRLYYNKSWRVLYIWYLFWRSRYSVTCMLIY